MSVTLKQLLQTLAFLGGSELHIATLVAPIIRFRGELLLLNIPPLPAEVVEQMAAQILTEEQKKAFQRDQAIDLAVKGNGIGVFKVTLAQREGGLSLTAQPMAEPQSGEIAWENVAPKIPEANPPVAAPVAAEATPPLFPEDEEATQVIPKLSASGAPADPWQTGLMKRRNLASDPKKRAA